MKLNIKQLALLAISVAALAGTTACDDKLDAVQARVAPQVEMAMPASLEGAKIVSERIEVKNVSTGRSTVFTSWTDVELAPGLYDFGYEAEVELDGVTRHVTAFSPSVELTGGAATVSLQVFENLVNDDFIIEEIFFTGTLQSSGNQYYGDDYVKIYNNTDHVLYADGLTFVESKFLTTEKYDFKPDIMGQAMTVQALYTIPGSGKDHPVLPGESLLLCDTGIDHRVANPNSFDLSGADFEWYDISTQPAHLDIDGPTVENLDKWYCYTLSFFLLHNRGFRAWALARIPVDKENYLQNYRYSYNYIIMNDKGTFPMSQNAYRLPNEWIVDAVNCSVEAEYRWNVTAPTLDRGWTYCGTMDHDKTRYFHSVRRKLLYVKDGRAVFQDTNNSTADFNPHCVPSEIENQGTAINAEGARSTGRTWDGVVPRD